MNSFFRLWKNQILILATVLVFAFYLVFLTAAPPYCLNLNRYLSNQELLEIVVANEISHGYVKLDNEKMSANDYVSQHSACCQVYRAQQKKWYETLLSSNSPNTEIDYWIEFVYQNKEERFVAALVKLEACGDVKKILRLGVPKEKMTPQLKG
ncbi:hypothetical protein ACO0LF_28010 [Undibacterium sp. Di27W]|uniref:hypothetical protein n=1 Tax=Undibacterium sp. Di27W TaxID=3413036 RepID=UPI003BF32263